MGIIAFTKYDFKNNLKILPVTLKIKKKKKKKKKS
jgi:hypothetical protein